MIIGTLLSPKKPSINYVNGLINRGLLQTDLLVPRHELLIIEMTERGFRHRTPVSDHARATLGLMAPRGRVCPGISAYELRRRCRECAERISLAFMREQFTLYKCRQDDNCMERMTSDFLARPTDPATGFAVLPES